MNEEVKVDMTLELYGKNVLEYRMKQADLNARFLTIRLTRVQVPIVLEAQEQVFVYVLKPDSKVVFTECEILDHATGLVKVPLTQQALALVGTIFFEVLVTSDILDEQKKLSFPIIELEVDDSIFDGEAIESQDEFSVLIGMTAKIQELEMRMAQIEALNGKVLMIE